MKMKCPDRVIDVSFDDPDGSIEQIGRKIFHFLRLEISDDQVSKWRKMQPAQPASKVVSRPLAKISLDAECMIERDPFYIKILERWPFLNT